MTDNSDLIAERQRLEAELARLRVERDTGVPASLLTNATTEAEARALADKALAWRGPAPQAPQPTASVQYSVSQISREQIRHLSPEQVSAAYRQGRLAGVGAPPPPPRNNGERRRP